MKTWKKNLLAYTIVAASVFGWSKCREQYIGFERETQKIINNDPNSQRIFNLEKELYTHLDAKKQASYSLNRALALTPQTESEKLKKDITTYRKNIEKDYKKTLGMLTKYEALVTDKRNQKTLEQIKSLKRETSKWVDRTLYFDFPGILGLFYLGCNTNAWIKKKQRKKFKK